MAELGIFYFDSTTGFPALVVKSVGGDDVMVTIFTDQGSMIKIATRSDTPSENVFVANG